MDLSYFFSLQNSCSNNQSYWGDVSLADCQNKQLACDLNYRYTFAKIYERNHGTTAGLNDVMLIQTQVTSRGYLAKFRGYFFQNKLSNSLYFFIYYFYK